MSKILLMSGEKGTLGILSNLLKTEGYKVVASQHAAKAKELLAAEEYNLMVVDVAGDDDLELISLARAKQPAMPVVTITKAGDVRLPGVVARLNPFAAIQKPLKVDQLLATVQKAVDYNDAALTDNVNLNLQLETCYQFADVVAESPAMRSVCDMVNRVAPTEITVLIVGESGTGKEVIARTLHDNSKRKDKPFTEVDGRREGVEMDLFKIGGLLETGNRGTLFLRHAEGLALSAQERIVKALLDRKVPNGDALLDLRVIASTSLPLEPLVAAGKFNANLFKLLRVIVIKIPPLRDRREDVMPTVRRVLRDLAGDQKAAPALDQKVVEVLERYSWPENTQTIRQVLGEALKLAQGKNRIEVDMLPASVRSAS